MRSPMRCGGSQRALWPKETVPVIIVRMNNMTGRQRLYIYGIQNTKKIRKYDTLLLRRRPYYRYAHCERMTHYQTPNIDKIELKGSRERPARQRVDY